MWKELQSNKDFFSASYMLNIGMLDTQQTHLKYFQWHKTQQHLFKYRDETPSGQRGLRVNETYHNEWVCTCVCVFEEWAVVRMGYLMKMTWMGVMCSDGMGL